MRGEPEAIKIGVLLDMSDGAGGSPMQGGVDAVEQRFEEALAAGELDRPVALEVRIVQGLPAGSAATIRGAFEDLAAAGVLGVIGPGVTDNCLVTQPLAEAHGLPSLNFPGTEHSRGLYGFQFQLGSLSDEGPMIVSELLARGHRTVAVVRDQGPIGAEYFSYFDQACQRGGLVVVSDQRTSPISDDLATAVKAGAASGATALVYLGLGLVIAPLRDALVAAGWDPPRFMNTAFLHGYANPDALAALEGWVGVDMVDLENPVSAAFFDRYERRTGQTITSPLHSCFYDMATMTVEGLRWAPVLTADGFRQGLERVHQLPSACGGMGTVMGFGPWDRAAYKGPDWLLFQEVRDGAYRPFAKAAGRAQEPTDGST